VRSLSVAGCLLSATLLSGSAVASERGEPGTITDRSHHERGSDLSLLLWIHYYYGYGIGGNIRYEIPVLPDGFIPSINDEFTLEPSLGIAATRYNYPPDRVSVLNLAPALYGLWSFWFSTPFRAYWGLGLGFNFATYTGTYPGFAPAYVFWDLVIGLSYNFNRDVAFRAELGTQGLKLGVSFYFY